MGLRKRIDNRTTNASTCPGCGHHDKTYLTATNCRCTRRDCACHAERTHRR